MPLAIVLLIAFIVIIVGMVGVMSFLKKGSALRERSRTRAGLRETVKERAREDYILAPPEPQLGLKKPPLEPE